MRFTTWLDSDERAALQKLAREHERSENFIVRMALRALLFNTPVPAYLKKEEVTK